MMDEHWDAKIMTRPRFLRSIFLSTLAAPIAGYGATPAAKALVPPSSIGAAKIHPATYAVNVRDFGARGDGVTKDHQAIQAAVDACVARGGGTVLVPAGTYLCGTIELKSNICLYLDAGAVIAGSPDRVDYRRFLQGNQFFTNNPGQPANHDQYLITGFKASNVSITGPGTIDGRGHQFYQSKVGPRGRYVVKSWRPGPAVAFLWCRDVSLSDFTIRDHPFFALFFHACSSIRVSSLRIFTDPNFQNADGIHVAASRGITITGCHVDTEDDALCFYTNYWGLPETNPDCVGVAVSNCVLSSICCGIRVGFGAEGRLGDMVFSNVVVRHADRGIDIISNANNFYQGTLNVTGPSVENLCFSNCVLADTTWGITGNIYSDAKAPAGIRNIHFSGMQVTSRRGNYLVGNPATPVHDITFRDVTFTVTGALAKPPVEIPDPLPIYAAAVIPHGFFLRHTSDIAFRDCRIRWQGARGAWQSGLHVGDGRAIDCRSLRVDRLHEDWTSGVTATQSKILMPVGEKQYGM